MDIIGDDLVAMVIVVIWIGLEVNDHGTTTRFAPHLFLQVFVTKVKCLILKRENVIE